ncbi:MAG: hypothetical protein J5486_09335 [Bacteroidaceae bacterium]|nr:hypothetical protein [Bacteroidaceae bacterium]
MKRIYIKPQVEMLEAQPQSMMALSIVQDAEANPDNEVLVKNDDWDIWE